TPGRASPHPRARNHPPTSRKAGSATSSTAFSAATISRRCGGNPLTDPALRAGPLLLQQGGKGRGTDWRSASIAPLPPWGRRGGVRWGTHGDCWRRNTAEIPTSSISSALKGGGGHI